MPTSSRLTCYHSLQTPFAGCQVSPGCCFFLPHGARIYNALVDMIKKEYWDRGYTEVVTPNVFSSELWVTSGHWQNYQDDMFIFDVEGTQMGLKPMNCPGPLLSAGGKGGEVAFW